MRKFLALAFLIAQPCFAQLPALHAGLGAPSGGGGGGLSIDGSAHSNATAASPTVTLTTTKSNDIIILIISTNGGPITSVSGAGLTWAHRVTAGPAGSEVEEWWALAASPLSSSVITVNNTSSAFTTIDAFGVNGAHTAAPFDTNASVPGSTGGDPITVSTTASNTIIIGGFSTSTASPTAGSGFTAVPGSGANFSLAEYKIVSSPQTSLTVGMTTGAGTAHGTIVDAIVQGP